jgi:hypothetical protein
VAVGLLMVPPPQLLLLCTRNLGASCHCEAGTWSLAVSVTGASGLSTPEPSLLVRAQGIAQTHGS